MLSGQAGINQHGPKSVFCLFLRGFVFGGDFTERIGPFVGLNKHSVERKALNLQKYSELGAVGHVETIFSPETCPSFFVKW